MRYLLPLLLIFLGRDVFADGTVSFSMPEIVVAQDAGQVIIPVIYDGAPTPLGTDDILVKFTDGTADAGYTYGLYGTLFDLNPIAYDFDSSQQTLNISVPIRLMQWNGSTYFTATLSGINGSTVGAIGSVKVIIAAWHPPQWILNLINKLEKRIKRASHIKNESKSKRLLKKLIKKRQALIDSIQPLSEL